MKLRSRSSDDRRACSCLTVRLSRKQLQFVFNVHLNWKPPRAHDHQLCSIRIVSCYTEANETGVNIRLDVTVTGGGGGGGAGGGGEEEEVQEVQEEVEEEMQEVEEEEEVDVQEPSDCSL